MGLGVAAGVVAGALDGMLAGLEDDGVLLGLAVLMPDDVGVAVALGLELGLMLVVAGGDDGAVEPVLCWPVGMLVVGWQAVTPTPAATKAIALMASFALFMARSS